MSNDTVCDALQLDSPNIQLFGACYEDWGTYWAFCFGYFALLVVRRYWGVRTGARRRQELSFPAPGCSRKTIHACVCLGKREGSRQLWRIFANEFVNSIIYIM